MRIKNYKLFFIGIVMVALFWSCTKGANDTYERFFFRFEGADLAIEVNGNFSSETFILLLHGGPGGNGLEYNAGRAMDELLESQYAVAYLDQRGQGASQGNYDDNQVTLKQFGRDAEAVCKMLKAKYGQEINLFLMGHSWGGLIGTQSLIDTEIENFIDGWIEVDGAHDIPLLNKEAIKMYQSIAPVQIGAGLFVDFWQEALDFVNSIDTANISDEESLKLNRLGFQAEARIQQVNFPDETALEEISLSNSPLGIAATISSNLTAQQIDGETEQAALTNRLSEITVPTLLLWGEYDFVVPPALATSALSRIPNAQMIILEHSGHSPMIYEPEAFANAIQDFIEEVLE